MPSPVLPRAPQVSYLLRKGDVTLFRWKPVTQDVLGKDAQVTSYNVYRSNNANLETFTRVSVISQTDSHGVIDTIFSEVISGFFSYSVSAVNATGEGAMSAGAEAVSSTVDQDLFS